ncbi:tyrosine-type recombinase/integrase, partial [Metamycoplasma auris]
MSLRFKEKIDLFLNSNYKNSKTKVCAKIALNRIADLDAIDINKINKIFENLKNSGSSKNTQLAYIKKFINTMSKIENKFYDVSKLISFENDTIPKQVFNLDEIQKIEFALEKWNNPEFKLIFNLLKYNGCRLGEFVSVDWENIYKTNYECQIKAKKHGRFRTIIVPYDLRDQFIKYGVKYSYNTIQNLFHKFSIYLKTLYPDWSKHLSAHVLRAQLITNMHMAGLSPDKIQVATGHVEISTITNHYIRTSSVYQKQLLQLGNMDSINSIEINKLKEIILLQNQEILKLRER